MKRWLTLILLVLLSLAFVVVPVILIQPFRPQTARALEVGYWLRRLAPWATLVAAILFVALAASAWRGSRRRLANWCGWRLRSYCGGLGSSPTIQTASAMA